MILAEKCTYVLTIKSRTVDPSTIQVCIPLLNYLSEKLIAISNME